jgi:transcriptional regulator with XRE-family HTH domain
MKGGTFLIIAFKDKEKIGKRIKQQRLKDKQSLRALAALCEMSYATLNDIETGNGFPTEKVFLKLIKSLNFSDREKMYDLYAQVKETAPPDVIEFLTKNKPAVEKVRQLIKEGADV